MAGRIIPSVFATDWSPSNLQTEKYWLSLEGIFQQVKHFGCGYVHLVYGWNFSKDDVCPIQELIRKYHVGISCVHSLTQLNRPTTPQEVQTERQQLRDAIAIADQFGSRLVACNFGQNISRDHSAAIVDCKRHYESCFKEANELGITVVVENTCSGHVGDEITTSTEGILALIEGVGESSFKVHFAPANLHCMGQEAYPFAYEQLKDHIRLVHLKDVARFDVSVEHHRRSEAAGKAIGSAEARYVSVPVGQGEVNLHGLIKRLVKDGYEGFLDIETHTVEERLDDFFMEGLKFISGHIV